MRPIKSLLAVAAMFTALSATEASAQMRGLLMRRMADEIQVHHATQEIEARSNTTRITQDGVNNGAAVSTFGQANVANLAQRGSNNVGTVRQNGDANDAYLRQIGAGHTANVTQNGNGAGAYIFQTGRGRTYNLNQISGERTLVIQSGRRTIVRELPPSTR